MVRDQNCVTESEGEPGGDAIKGAAEIEWGGETRRREFEATRE